MLWSVSISVAQRVGITPPSHYELLSRFHDILYVFIKSTTLLALFTLNLTSLLWSILPMNYAIYSFSCCLTPEFLFCFVFLLVKTSQIFNKVSLLFTTLFYGRIYFLWHACSWETPRILFFKQNWSNTTSLDMLEIYHDSLKRTFNFLLCYMGRLYLSAL